MTDFTHPTLRTSRGSCLRIRLLTAATMLLGIATPILSTAQEVIFNEKLLATIPSDIDRVRDFFVSPDQEFVAYLAQKGDAYFLVTGKKKGSEFHDPDPFSSILTSRDEKIVAFQGRSKGGLNKARMVVNNRESEEFDSIDSTALSEDGRRIAYGHGS